VEKGRDAVLIIDEAQNLTEQLLEQVRMLSNLELDNRKLLQIVLMGQPELRDRLNSPNLRQLRQRITVRYHLSPLSQGEISQYIQHRLEVSGAKGAPRFTRPALWRIHHYTGGIPRLVNAVCDKALLAGYVSQTENLDYRVIGKAIQELEGEVGS
jgi:general secretion pathway protein A